MQSIATWHIRFGRGISPASEACTFHPECRHSLRSIMSVAPECCQPGHPPYPGTVGTVTRMNQQVTTTNLIIDHRRRRKSFCLSRSFDRDHFSLFSIFQMHGCLNIGSRQRRPPTHRVSIRPKANSYTCKSTRVPPKYDLPYMPLRLTLA